MRSRLSLLALLGVAGCSFPTDGVPIGGVDAAGDVDGAGEVDATGVDGCAAVDETCDGADQDCDGIIDEGFAVAAACDGADSDQCTEGANACAPDGLGVVCSDATGDTLETCDGSDEDCDGIPDNGFDLTADEANCGDCGNLCSNDHGTTACITSACTPTCANGAAQCNGVLDDGCELVDTSPACAATPAVASVSVAGDDDADSTATVTGTTERFLRVEIREDHSGGMVVVDRDPRARLMLTSGAGTDFDLFVYCLEDCNLPPQSANNDTIDVGKNDVAGSNTFEVIVEIRYDPTTPSTTCAAWTLEIDGNTGGGGTACPG